MSPNKAAKQIALDAYQQIEVVPTTQIELHAGKKVALLAAPKWVNHPAWQANGYVLTSFEHVEQLHLSGHLGQFHLSRTDKNPELAADGTYDLVVDASPHGLLSQELKPFGYVHAPYDPNLDPKNIIESLADWVGDFSKPKYFNYDSQKCAHARSGIIGCQRCRTACPAGAISYHENNVVVNPNLCQGGGSCTAVCPSGALTYSYPHAGTTLNGLRVLISSYYTANGSHPVIVFASEQQAQRQQNWPDHVFTVVVEEIASVGPELSLGALAFGAKRAILLTDDDLPTSSHNALLGMLTWQNELLAAMGYPDNLTLDSVASALSSCADHTTYMPDMPPAKHQANLDDKRQNLELVIEHLYHHRPSGNTHEIALSDAPFGSVHLNSDACTLCLACTSICPTHALRTQGNDRPTLAFVETSCVQCGICTDGCPEKALSIRSRWLTDRQQRHKAQVLKTEEPFYCISCQTPFSTNAIVNKMLSLLDAHPMYQDKQKKSVLKMCADCRVKTLAELNQLD